MMRIVRRFSIVSVVMLLGLAGCTQAQHNPRLPDPDWIFGYDKNLPLGAEVSVAEETPLYICYKVVYRSARDQRVPAFLVLPKNRQEGQKLPCVILMHGLGGDKSMLKMLWPLLLNAGYALFAIDAQYHGERKPKDPLPFFGVYPYYSRDALIQTVIDLRRAVDYLETRPEIDPKRIGYIGASMGGMLGAIFAGVDERVQAPVLLVAGGNWKIIMEKSVLSVFRENRSPKEMEQALKAMDVVDPIHWVGRISPRPVLMINGDADDVVPVDSNKALHEAAREPKKIIWYKGGHVPPPAEMPNLLNDVLNWLNEHLKGQAKSTSLWQEWRDRLRNAAALAAFYLPALWQALRQWLMSLLP
ncbi:MAG: alpha/beta fold hydrolase [Fimbriimonadales bacterium]|nr:alpha/beta fold hydrolase [Fimbriimonadales bacterium]